MMIFLSVLSMLTYALFGVPPVAPVQPVQRSEKVRQSPRTRQRKVKDKSNNSKRSRFSWWSDTAVSPNSTPEKPKPNKRGTIVPRTNRGYELRLSACLLKQDKPQLEGCTLSRSLSYTLARPSVAGLPNIRPCSPSHSKPKKSSGPSRRSKSPQRSSKSDSTTKQEPNVMWKKALACDAKASGKQYTLNVAKITRSTWSGLCEQFERIVKPLSNVISTNDKVTKTRRFGNKTMSTITKVTRDPRTKKVTVYEAKTRPLSKTRPSAAPTPPIRWRF